MAQKSFLVDLNLNGNQLKQVRVDNTYIDATTGLYGDSVSSMTQVPGIGQLAYDLNTDAFKYCIGATDGIYIWKSASGSSSASFEDSYDVVVGSDNDGNDETVALVTRFYSKEFEGTNTNAFGGDSATINDVDINTDIAANVKANFAGQSYEDIRKMPYNQLLTRLLFRDVAATYTDASLSLSVSPNTVQFVGTTVSESLTATYIPSMWTNGDGTKTNRTAATGAISITQGSTSIKSETAAKSTATHSLAVAAGANVYTATVTYAGTGEAGKSSFGSTSGSAVTTSTTSTKTASQTITGVYPILSNGTIKTTSSNADTYITGTTIMTSDALKENSTAINNGTTLYFYTLAETTAFKWSFAIPTAYGTPKSIKGYSPLKGDFSVDQTTSTKTASYDLTEYASASGVSYTVYTNTAAQTGCNIIEIKF